MSLKPDQPRDAPSRQCQQSRRALLLGSLVQACTLQSFNILEVSRLIKKIFLSPIFTLLQATFQIKSAQAKQVARNQEADAATSPYIQGVQPSQARDVTPFEDSYHIYIDKFKNLPQLTTFDMGLS